MTCNCHPDFHDIGTHAPTQTTSAAAINLRIGETVAGVTNTGAEAVGTTSLRQSSSLVSRLRSGPPALINRLRRPVQKEAN